GSAQRRVKRPSNPSSFANKGGKGEENNGRNKQPKAHCIQARERHIRRTNHKGNKPITKTPDEGWHNKEKHHKEAVSGNNHVVHLMIATQSNPRWMGKLQTHNHG